MSAPQENAGAPAAAPVEGNAAAAPAAAQGGNEDYLDKALDTAERKIGGATGHNIDPTKYRNQNEKITDKIRALIEKFTGKKLPSKVSN